MTDIVLFNQVLVAVFIAAAVTFVALLFIDAPYGKRDREGWGPGINVRLGWLLLELPAFAVFGWCYLQGEHRSAAIPLLLFFLWQIHYFHRTFIYPFQIRVKPGAREKLVLLLTGVPFNAANGYLNGTYLSNYADHLYTTSWFYDPRYLGGVMIFIAGFYIAKQSDRILRHLRKPGESGYKIPQGGFYRFVSCPNYFGELLQWTGFAIASWSLAGLAFVMFTAANLVPRALTSHRWYREQFPDYPRDRKAIFPFLL